MIVTVSAAGVICAAAIVLAKDLLAPIALSLVLALILSPLIEALHQRRVPRALTAAIALLGTLVMTYFILASGPGLLEASARSERRSQAAVRLVLGIRSDLARYLGWLTLINVAVGAAVAVLCTIAGVPNRPRHRPRKLQLLN